MKRHDRLTQHVAQVNTRAEIAIDYRRPREKMQVRSSAKTCNFRRPTVSRAQGNGSAWRNATCAQAAGSHGRPGDSMMSEMRRSTSGSGGTAVSARRQGTVN